jgi:hypothetical protein
MVGETRYRTYDTVSSFLLSWLSLSVLAWAVVHSPQPPSPFLDTYTALLSTFVFAFSIITFGFRFGETAVLHRECYLRLERLIACEKDEEILVCQYHEILAAYGNHSNKDFEALVLQRTLFTGREVRGGDNKTIEWTTAMLVKYALRNGSFWLGVLVVFAMGVVPYYFILKRV